MTIWQQFQLHRSLRRLKKINAKWTTRLIEQQREWSLRPVVRRPHVGGHCPSYRNGDLVCSCGFRCPWFTQEARDHAMDGANGVGR